MNREQLAAYCARIGIAAPQTPDLPALATVMQAHLATVPFENIDVQLGRRISLEPDAIFDKLVTRRRGGWCYEQNGLLGVALTALGFVVTRVAGGVMRVAMGEAAVGNHLTLLVRIEGQPWLVDVGFGGSQAEPLPLAAGSWLQPPFGVSLSEPEPGWWRYEETIGGAPFSYDFTPQPAPEMLLAEKCAWLQTDDESPFVQNLVTQQRIGDTHLVLRGRVLTERTSAGESRELLVDANALVATLHDRFGLDVPEVASLWSALCDRHAVLFGEPDAAAS